MKRWVRYANGDILAGPLGVEASPGPGWIEYDEVIDLPERHGPVTVSVSLVGGKCIKTVSAQVDYQAQRRAEYPDAAMFLDAFVKNDAVQMQAYMDACMAVKIKYPKPA